MDADTKIQELVEIIEEIHARIEKLAAEIGVKISLELVIKKRNQHYVPRCYLELWRDSGKSLYQSVKGGKPIQIKGDSNKIAQSKDFYRIRSITEEDRIFLLGLVKTVKSPDISNFFVDFIKIYELTGGLMQVVSGYTWPQTSGDAEIP